MIDRSPAGPWPGLVCVALLAACGPDDPEPPGDDTAPATDTAPEPPEPPRVTHAQIGAFFGWDDEAGAVRDVTVQSAPQVPGAVLSLRSQYDDPSSAALQSDCQVAMLLDLEAVPVDEGSEHRLALEGPATHVQILGCRGWDLEPIGGGGVERFQGMQWRIALGGPLSPKAEVPAGMVPWVLGATLEPVGVLGPTEIAYAGAAAVDEEFAVLRDAQGDMVLLSSEEALEGTTLSDAFYLVQTTFPIAAPTP